MSSLCPTLRGETIAIKGRIRTTVYIDDALFVRGRADGLNFSEIINLALSAIYGVDYGKDRMIIQEKIQKMQESVSKAVEMEKNDIKAVQQQTEAAAAIEAEKKQRIMEVLDHPVGEGRLFDMAKRRLYDPHGDYLDWWQDLVADISRKVGADVSVQDIQRIVRRGAP